MQLVLKSVTALSLILLAAPPLLAQRHLDLIVDAEGVRSDRAVQFEPNVVVYEPRFDDGGGAGLGLNYYFSSRVSLEVKASILTSRLRLRRTGSDFFANADLGRAHIYPLTAVLQWHMLDPGAAIQPYLGVGAGHVIIEDLKKRTLDIAGIEFEDPTGVVVNGGFLIGLSRKLSASVDLRYTPLETQARARFVGTESVTEIDVKPLVVAVGIVWHF